MPIEVKTLKLIYALLDPLSKEIKYIGKSSRGMLEPKTYSKPSASKGKRKVSKWIKKLQKLNLKPEILIIEENIIDEKTLNEREIFNISYYRSLGCDLKNLTDGGEGSVGHKHTDEARKKISEASKNQVWTEERKKNISEANKGRKVDPEHNRKLQEGKVKYFKENGHPKWVNNVNKDLYLKALAEAGKKGNLVSTELCGIPIVDQNGVVYNSQAQAARLLNLSKSEICNNLKGKAKSVKGYTFKRLVCL